jgi:Zn-dependent protease with chaperone function
MVWDALQPAVDWLGDGAFAQWLGQSQARIAALFVVHLVGLTLLLGGTVVISLRLLGLTLQSAALAQLAREIAPWWMAGLALMLVSGSLMFTGGAVSYFEGDWFRRKMLLLIGALIFSFTWFRAVIIADEGRFSIWQQRVTAGLALLLWFGVGMAGRAIAFF